jgi:hypothetical protein
LPDFGGNYKYGFISKALKVSAMQKKEGIMKKMSILGICIIALVALATWAPNASAYSNFNGGCDGCHGDFRSGTYTSNTSQDPVSWGTNLHSAHQDMVSRNCSACHPTSGYNNPPLGGPSGDGFNSCMGCHGRNEDANNLGDGPGRGAGLRQHHWVNQITSCSGCHGDSDPAAFTPVGEDVPGARNAALGIDPCSDVVFGVFGSDNDGDNLYDGDDPDCQAAPTTTTTTLPPTTTTTTLPPTTTTTLPPTTTTTTLPPTTPTTT